jgi:hypothetical protein
MLLTIQNRTHIQGAESRLERRRRGSIADKMSGPNLSTYGWRLQHAGCETHLEATTEKRQVVFVSLKSKTNNL